ncbi:hypothetical protein PVK06_005769 [Gossypium arboreum]|uniref:RNase H type-1 domain-containing protein n=1 Tax=Gossypium arboreum TaxID=29729 RepID=A0ABR0QVE6_GOSAR|nr:hypothetical protein PVK06_005769 [Gossypium arboreum]
MADSFNAMDHDIEDSVLMREEGNKRQRGDVEGLTGKDRKINFHHIPKSENTFAHVIAKEALKENEGHYLDGGIPEHVRRVLERRRPRAPD